MPPTDEALFIQLWFWKLFLLQVMLTLAIGDLSMRILQPFLTFERIYNRWTPIHRGGFAGTHMIRWGVESLGLQPPILPGPEGIRLEYSPKIALDTVVRDTLLQGSFEAREVEILRSHTSESGVFIDVGANIGYFTLLASRWVGSAGRVYAFEPVRQTYTLLRRNLVLNNCVNVATFQVACAAEPGELSIVTEQDSGKAYLSPDGQGQEQVAVTTVDCFATEQRLDRLDMVKIDVEGADFEVVKGARQTIKRFRPVIWLETLFLSRFGAAPSDVVEYLEPLGYTCMEQKNKRSMDMLCVPHG
jgi:FkbM family methyltransferase